MIDKDIMAIAIAAVNRWIFHGWNYELVPFVFHGFNGLQEIYVPRFIVEVKWTCNLDHMLSKWKIATHTQDPDTYLVKFYAELGNENRQLLIEWVMENYVDERNILDTNPLKK